MTACPLGRRQAAEGLSTAPCSNDPRPSEGNAGCGSGGQEDAETPWGGRGRGSPGRRRAEDAPAPTRRRAARPPTRRRAARPLGGLQRAERWGRWGSVGDGSQENRTWAPSRPGPHRGAASTSKGGAGRGDVRRRSPERGRDAGPEPTRLLAHARGGAAPRRPGGSESAQAANLIHAAGPGGRGGRWCPECHPQPCPRARPPDSFSRDPGTVSPAPTRQPAGAEPHNRGDPSQKVRRLGSCCHGNRRRARLSPLAKEACRGHTGSRRVLPSPPG